MSEKQNKYGSKVKILNNNMKASMDVKDEDKTIEEENIYTMNSLLLEAERIIELVDTQIYSLAKLTRDQKSKLNMYFYTFNPTYRRIVNLFTKLPLSYITLQKPKESNSIVQDYVYSFFIKMLGDCKWSYAIRQAYLYYFLFGSSFLLLEDNSDMECDKPFNDINSRSLETVDLQSLKAVKEGKIEISSIKDAVNKIIDDYNIDKAIVNEKKRLFVINATIPNYNPNYNGIFRMRCIDPFEVLSFSFNPEINYVSLEMNKSKYIDKYMQSTESKDIAQIKKELLDIGYSSGYINVNLANSNKMTIEINSSPYSDLYVAEFKSLSVCGIESSPLDAILSDTLDFTKARMKQKERLHNMNRKGLLVTPSGDHEYDLQQMEELVDNIITSADAGSGFVAYANYGVSVEEVDLTTQDKIDVDGIMDIAQNNMAIGSGTPQGMITGDDSYGNNYLKMEVLNEEFFAQRADFSTFINDQIFIPMAVKKGFIDVDDFGNPIPIIPRINYKVGTIVNSTEFRDLLRDLADSEQIPYALFLEYLGIDPEDSYTELVKERKRKEQADEIISSYESPVSDVEDDDMSMDDDMAPADDEMPADDDFAEDSTFDDEAPADDNSDDVSMETQESSEPNIKPENGTETII